MTSQPMRDWRTAALLAATVLIGFVLRVYRLDEQSLWWDDYNGLAHLTLDGFFASMAESRRMNPEGAPLYHVVQIMAAQIIGTGEYAQRMLNVLISTLTIVAVFFAGKMSFGVRAGLVAALLFALSPPHIYHAQSLRIYPLAMLFGAVSLLTMERMLTQRDPRWLYLNAFANGALCLTHLFGLFGVLAQGTAALILLGMRHRDFLIRWCKVQFVCLLPAGLLVLTMRQRSGGDFWHFAFPSGEAIVKDLIGDDLTDFAVTRTRSAAELFGAALDTQSIGTPMANAMMAVFLLVAVFALVQVARIVWKQRSKDAPVDQDARLAPFVLMLCFWALPVVYLVILAYFWQPVVYPRYTLYACAGLYVLTGALVQATPWRLARWGFVAILIVLYAYQLTLLLTSDTRTQWRQAARDVAAQAGPDDIVLVGAFGPPDTSYRTFTYHFPADLDLPITKVYSTLDLVEQLRCHFLRHADAEEPPNAWYVFNPHYHRSDIGKVRRYLDANEIRFEHSTYPAEEGLRVYRARAWNELTPETEVVRPENPPTNPYPQYDHAADMRAIGFEDWDEALAYDFERAFEDGIIFGDGFGILSSFVSAFLDFGAFDSARASILQYESQMDADSPHNTAFLWWRLHLFEGDLEAAFAVLLAESAMDHAALALSFTLWAAGERETAQAGYRAYRDARPRDVLGIQPIFDAILLDDATPLAERTLAYRSLLLPHADRMEGLVYLVSGRERWISACTPPWAPQPVSQATLDAAKEAMTNALP